MKNRLLFACMFLGMASFTLRAGARVDEKNDASLQQRIADLVGKMTLEEKIDLLSGTGFTTRPLQRLGIPSMAMSDGPAGVKTGGPATGGLATCFPSPVCMAATWNPALVGEIGRALGREAKRNKIDVLLGPCVNIHRVPMGGRNFESFGEDPFLAASMSVAYVKGVQSERVAAVPKHFACNNQEFHRWTLDAEVDERTLNEIYLPAFKASVVEGGALGIIAAYNRLNGKYCCENSVLLTDILKNAWGFAGVAMSDWDAVQSCAPSLAAGLDLEMPVPKYMTRENVLKAIRNGDVSQAAIDDKVTRLLRVMFSVGKFDPPKPAGSFSPDPRTLARTAAAEGMVLLKNNKHLLPLNVRQLRTLAVIGPNAAAARTGGGGSSYVSVADAITPLLGIRNFVNKNRIKIYFSQGTQTENRLIPIPPEYMRPSADPNSGRGLMGAYFDNMDFAGKPVFRRVDSLIAFSWGARNPIPGLKPDSFSVRWTGFLNPPQTGDYSLVVSSDDGSRLYLDGRLVVDNWGRQATTVRRKAVRLEAGKPVAVRLDYFQAIGGADVSLGWLMPDPERIAHAVKYARKASAAIVFAGYSDFYESEAMDRPDLGLPLGQAELIEAVAAVNPKTIVVLNAGASVDMQPWIEKIPALVMAWYGGEETGNAVADVLFGRVNPSGKLPTTMLRRWEDSPAYGNYPGVDDTVRYAEGIFVGYRGLDARGVEPLFPFGFGLSYSTYSLTSLDVRPALFGKDDSVRVSLDVTNTGRRAGAEVVQVYVSDPESRLPRPVRELKAFQKVFLKPGEKKRVSFTLGRSAFQYYDSEIHDWVLEPGLFKITAGNSSRDLRLSAEVRLE